MGKTKHQVAKTFKDSSYTSSEMHATTYYSRAEDKLQKDMQSMLNAGYTVKTILTTGSRGFFINDFVQTVIYERED